MQTIINTYLHPLFIQISTILGKSVEIVWYYPVVFICLLCGIFFTLRFGFVQFKGFRHAIDLIKGKYDNPDEPGHITHFQALMAALSGTIGLGNIAGVAIAISIGGPGTIFWMWLVGILGMATKFAECTLGTKYREKNPETNAVYGGPMFYIKKKLPNFLQPLGIDVIFNKQMINAPKMYIIHIVGTIFDATFPIRFIPPIITKPTKNARIIPVINVGMLK